MNTVNATRNECIHDRFAARANERADAVALTCGARSLTYGELEQRSNRLARHLRGLGVGPDTLVGLCVDRSPEMLVGIFGILKAGGAYVPLDPAYPAERLEYLLADSGAPVVLAGRGERALVEAGGARIVELGGGAFDGESDAPLEPLAGPDNVAYVIYTSGSTGKPKGVLVEHRNVVRLFDSTAAWFGFGPDDVWSLFHSFGFDFSVWEIFGALLHGGRLVVVPADVARSTERFRELCAQEGVTFLSQTPSAFRQFIRADALKGQVGDLALRWVVFGGEALDPTMLAPWFERHGDQRPRLVNMYGITETTVHVTFRPLAAADAEARGTSPIGQPIPDLTLHIVDENGDEVPVGAAGEILVGGAGVARGYLNRPELTAERFVPDRFSGQPGARLYRSGDLGVRTADGGIDYQGRSDDQLKIRGYRIEPGEVEACLRGCPGVADVAVAAPEIGDGEKRLVAYVVAAAGVGLGLTDALRRHAEASLPPQMRPAVFVPIREMPLTAHGKLDRRALPVPQFRPALANEFKEPATPAEQALLALWEEILGIHGIGVQDDFFDLGGSSISLVNLFLQIQERFGAELDLSALSEGATVEALAKALPPGVIVAPTV